MVQGLPFALFAPVFQFSSRLDFPEEDHMLKDTLKRFGTLRRLRPNLRALWRGYSRWRSHSDWSQLGPTVSEASDHPNLLLKYFNEHKDGHGIWKFIHYFDVYERHFAPFRGKEAHILEIGVYSGGSLEMWRNYFGPRCKVYGVDIQPSCKVYESGSVRVFIGDQSDRDFWKRVKREVPVLDIVIDDGGHAPEQQIVTLEELLPHLRPGGVYLCEDVTTVFNEFAWYVTGLAQNLNAVDWGHDFQGNLDDNERRQVCKASPLQSAVASIHLYPFLALIERATSPVSEFVAPKHGTQWQPFLK
jgi:hypothetical protein